MPTPHSQRAARADLRPAGSSLPATTRLRPGGSFSYFLLPAMQDGTSSVLETVTAVPTLPGTQRAASGQGPGDPRSLQNGGRRVTQAPPPPQAGAAHLKAWPQRWACARWWAWLGSFRPLPLAAPRCDASPGRRPAPRRSSTCSLIHSFLCRSGPGGEWAPPDGASPNGPRERRLGSAGRVDLAGCRRSPTSGPRYPAPHHHPGRPGTGNRPRRPDFRDNRKQNSSARGGRAGR